MCLRPGGSEPPGRAKQIARWAGAHRARPTAAGARAESSLAPKRSAGSRARAERVPLSSPLAISWTRAAHPLVGCAGEGSYAKLLGVNVYGLLTCTAACALGFALDQIVVARTPFATARTVREPDTEHYLTGESVPCRAAAAVELEGGPGAAATLSTTTQA